MGQLPKNFGEVTLERDYLNVMKDTGTTSPVTVLLLPMMEREEVSLVVL
jgi:hypothetical protein